jgi:hypothetical protein
VPTEVEKKNTHIQPVGKLYIMLAITQKRIIHRTKPQRDLQREGWRGTSDRIPSTREPDSAAHTHTAFGSEVHHRLAGRPAAVRGLVLVGTFQARCSPRRWLLSSRTSTAHVVLTALTQNYSFHATHNLKLCLRSGDAFVITCVANLMEVKFLYVQQDLRYEIYSYWRFNV